MELVMAAVGIAFEVLTTLRQKAGLWTFVKGVSYATN
jgi:hypothetical protein